MLIKEYRVVLPVTVEEYQVGQLYSVAEASRNETGGGEGVEVLKNEPFDNHPLLGDRFSTGQYTYKIYHLASKVPGYIRILAPKGSLEVHEEAWNAYPYCRTVCVFGETLNCSNILTQSRRMMNPDYMKDGFKICIETMHCSDRGDQENVHELSSDMLKLREVTFIDIGNDPIQPKDYKETEDPTLFKSKLTNRGPLIDNWQETADPVMCAYKLVTVEFKWLGLQSRVESFIQRTEQRLFLNFHRQVFCWIDKWHGLTMKDIREIEEKTKAELSQQLAEGTVRGTSSE